MKIFPTKNQWKKWSLPSKITYIGCVIGVIAFLFAIFTWVFSNNTTTERHKELIEKIDKQQELIEKLLAIQPHEASDSLKEEVRTATERIINPKTADDFFLKGFAAQMDGNQVKALEYYQKAIQLNPKFKGVYLNIGSMYLFTDKYEEAIKYYQKEIELNPKFAFAYNNIGIAYDKMGKYEEAIKYYQKAIEVNPEYAEACYNKGLTYNNIGKYDEAIKSFRKAIKLNPKYTEAYNNMGNAYIFIGKYEEAIQSYQKVIELNPNDASVYNNMGNAYNITGKYEEAVQSFYKAIELKPDEAEPYNNLGVICNDFEIYDEAIKLCRTAIEINPEFKQAYYNLGNAYLYTGKYKEAIKSYQKAIDLNPEYANAYHNMGKAYEKSGNQAKAKECIQKYNEISKKNKNDENSKVEGRKVFKNGYEIKEAKMFLQLPNKEWFLADNSDNKGLTLYIFKRNGIVAPNGRTIVPAIMLYIEDAKGYKQDVVAYSSEKISAFPKIQIKKTLTPNNKELPFSSFKNAMLTIASYSDNGFDHVLYMVYIINKENKGIQLYMDMTKDIADKYEKEFWTTLKSIKELK